MRKITALHARTGKRNRVNVSLDDRFAFSLEAEVVTKEELQVGQELTTAQAENLTKSDYYHRCLNAASHYLSYRPQSESELRERLQRRGFDDDCIKVVLAKLKRQGLVDDVAFARFWKDNRESFSPRSQRLTKLELRRKGIVSDIIEQVVATIDDSESAYRVAISKARHLPSSDYRAFFRRLGGYLKRRGFDYEVINHTVERVWQERVDSPG